MLVIGSTLHLLYRGPDNDIASHAWGINAGSLTRLSGSDLALTRPWSHGGSLGIPGNTSRAAFMNDAGTRCWFSPHRVTFAFTTDVPFYGYTVSAGGVLTRSTSDDFDIPAFPGAGAFNGGVWQHGGYLYSVLPARSATTGHWCVTGWTTKRATLPMMWTLGQIR